MHTPILLSQPIKIPTQVMSPPAFLPWRCLLFSIVMLATTVRAVTPAPDGGYPFQNTAEGDDALFKFLLGGYYGNTAVGYHALYSTDRGSYNTAVGNEALRSVHGLLGDGNTAGRQPGTPRQSCE
jgi:hypothetical protein